MLFRKGFEIDPLNGENFRAFIMSHKAEIDAFRARQDAKRFFSTTTPSIG